MVQSVLAVLGGFATMAVLVMLTTAVAVTLLVPGGMMAAAQTPAPLPRRYIITNLTCSAVAAFVGGGITARIAAGAPVQHGVALAALMVAMSLVSMRSSQGLQPRWYQVTLMTVMPPVAILGAWTMEIAR